MTYGYKTMSDGTILPYPIDTQLPSNINTNMNLKITKEITMTPSEIKDVIISHLYRVHNLSGIFDVKFIIKNQPLPGVDIHDSIDHWIFDGVNIRISENENLQK